MSLGYIVDAANTLFLTQQILKPGNQLWQYQKEKDITDLQKNVMDKINTSYKFPLIIEQIKTKPQIYNIYPQTFNDSYETVIKYYSHIDLKDTIKLKAENLEIRKVIGVIKVAPSAPVSSLATVRTIFITDSIFVANDNS